MCRVLNVLIGGLGSKWREDVKTGAGTGKLNTLNYHKIWQRKQNSEWILGGNSSGNKCFENVQFEYLHTDICVLTYILVHNILLKIFHISGSLWL